MTITRDSIFRFEKEFMFENYKIITVTHQHLNVEDISQFTVIREDCDTVEKKLAFLSQQLATDEIIYLNTCNRVSYLFFSDGIVTESFIKSFFKSVNPNIHPEILESLSKY